MYYYEQNGKWAWFKSIYKTVARASVFTSHSRRNNLKSLLFILKVSPYSLPLLKVDLLPLMAAFGMKIKNVALAPWHAIPKC
jgi:hypothetical protein